MTTISLRNYRVRHYADDGSRKRGRTACGVLLVAHKHPGYVTGARTTEDMDRVTCKRCITSWNRFVKDGGAGK